MGVYTVNQTDGSLVRVAGGTLYADAPIGAIQSYGGEIAPAGWLICDGSTLSRTDYAELFAVIGINFGEGDGETTFNIPDLRECVPVGAGKNITKSIAAHDRYTLGQFKDDQLQEHTHTFTTVGSGSGMLASGGSYNLVVTETTSSNSGRSGTTTHGKQLGVNYIIKAKQVGMPADFASAVGDIVVDKNTYSTSETIVGKWIDGKPIYRRVFNINNPSTNWTEVILLNPCNIDWIVKRDYTAKRTNNAVLTEYYNHDSDNFEIHLLVHDGMLGYYCQCSTILSAMSITIEYTKAD